MLKNATYKEKFALLNPWIPYIIDSIKKDLKNDHLKQDWQFSKRYLNGKPASKLTTEELIQGYSEALQDSEKGEALAEFIANRWLLKHTDLYDYFEAKLSAIHPDFVEIEELELKSSQEIIKGAVVQFGALHTYLFSVINSVVFPQEIYNELSQQATREAKKAAEEQLQAKEREVNSLTTQQYEQQLARLTDKYEKKLSGWQKKYTQDIESLKKQLAQLQKKLSER